MSLTEDAPRGTDEIPGQLTSHPVGSIRELWTLFFPIMMSLLASGSMVLFDRIFLAHYSTTAFSAVSEAAMFFMTFEYTVNMLVAAAEVLVGKAYGAARYDAVARPVWAMIWASLFSSLLFIPLGLFGSAYLFAGSPHPEYSCRYFSTLCFFGPIFALNTALSSFWIGRGRMQFITMIIIGINVLNIGIDPILIFGLGPIPSLGGGGAALARGISQTLLALMLFAFFFSKANRQRYGTWNPHFEWKTFVEAFSFGLMNSLSMLGQCSAWSVFWRIMALAGQTHAIANSISDAMYFFFTFFIEGAAKAISSVVSNVVGAGRYDDLTRVIGTGVKFIFGFGILLAVFYALFPNFILHLFVPDGTSMEGIIWSHLQLTLIPIWLVMIGESFLIMWAGVLLAFDEARFAFITSTIFVWGIGVIPSYFIVFNLHAPAYVVLGVASSYYIITTAAYLVRIREKLTLFRGQKQAVIA